jgi:hypothetical protein
MAGRIMCLLLGRFCGGRGGALHESQKCCVID